MIGVKRKIPVLALVLSLGLPRLVAAVEFPGWQPYDKLSRDVVTPHIAFAEPYYKGRIRALVIAPCWTQRETVELAQRLAMDFTPLMTESYECFGVYPNAGERTDYLKISEDQFRQVVREKINGTYELIIIGKIPWDVIYPEVQTWILDRIKSGTGLVYIGPSKLPGALTTTVAAPETDPGRAAILEGIPLRALPVSQAVSPQKLVRTGLLGQGRMVLLDYGQTYDPKNYATSWVDSLTPFGADDPLYYDYHHALLAKACLWATDKSPGVHFASLPETKEILLGDHPRPWSLTFTLAGEDGPSIATGTIHCTLRDHRNQIEYEMVVSRSGDEVTLEIPIHSGGAKMLDVWLRDRHGRTVNWASVPVTVHTSFGTDQIALEDQFYNPRDKITGSVQFSGNWPRGARFTLAVFDNLERLVWAGTPAIKEGRADFRFQVSRPLTVLHRLRATMTSRDGVTATAETVFYVSTDGVPVLERDYPMFVFGVRTGNSRAIRVMNEQFRAAGIDAPYATGAYWQGFEQSRAIAEYLAEFNMNASPYATHIGFAMDQHAHLQPVPGPDGPEIRNCVLSQLPAEQKTNSQLKHLRSITEAYRPFAPVFYSLGDEDVLSFPYSDVCFCGECQQAFREYLQEVYPSLEALNQEWGTAYSAWTEVKPLTLMAADAQRRYAPWIDHRLFMDRQFTRYHLLCADQVLKIVPNAKVGSEGAIYPAQSGTGWNWYELLPHLKFFGPYRSPIDAHAALSWLPKDALVASWFGSYRGETHEQHMRYFPWATLLEGCNSVGWWPVAGSGLGGPSTIAPDGALLPHFRQALEEIHSIRSGIGKLLLGSERQHQPIALYYSNVNLHASNLKPKLSSWENSLKDFHYALADGRFDYRYISPIEMRNDRLKTVKVLVLPYALGLSAAEVEKIKDFVRAGGVLMADFLPAIMDEHGKELPQSQLVDVFGEFERMNIHSYGRGHAVCLDDFVKGYHKKRLTGAGKGVCTGIIRLIGELTGGAVQPFVEITNQDGEIRQDIESSLFQNGKALYLGLVRAESQGSLTKPAGPEAGGVSGANTGESSSIVNVTLPERHFVYELRENRFVGQLDQLSISLAPALTRVFALLPCPVNKVKLTTNRRQYRQGDTIQFQATVLPARLRGCGLCVRTELVDPDGEPLSHYTRKIVSQNGVFKGSILLSLNEKPGLYKLMARDIVSGLETVRTFRVTKRGTTGFGPTPRRPSQ